MKRVKTVYAMEDGVRVSIRITLHESQGLVREEADAIVSGLLDASMLAMKEQRYLRAPLNTMVVK